MKKEFCVLLARYLAIIVSIIVVVITFILLVSVDAIELMGKYDRYFHLVSITQAVLIFLQSIAMKKMVLKNSVANTIKYFTILLFIANAVLYLAKLK